MTAEKIFETELKKAGYPLTLKKELTTKFVYEYTLSYGEKDTTELPKEVQPTFAKSYASSVIKTINITEKLHKLENKAVREYNAGYTIFIHNDFANEDILKEETPGEDERELDMLINIAEAPKLNPNFSFRIYAKTVTEYSDGTSKTSQKLVYERTGKGLE